MSHESEISSLATIQASLFHETDTLPSEAISLPVENREVANGNVVFDGSQLTPPPKDIPLDSEALFFQQLEHPLLNYTQEQRLFRLGTAHSRRNVPIQEVTNSAQFPDVVSEFPEKEQERFTEIVANSENLQQLLVAMNMRLVVAVAKRYAPYGDQLFELIQEGTFGLMDAVEKFDVDRIAHADDPQSQNIKFSTHAMWWIRAYIQRAVHNKSRTVRLPVHVEQAMYKAKTINDAYELEHGRPMSREDLKLHLEASGKTPTIAKIAVDEVREGRLTRIASLNKSINTEGFTLETVVVDTSDTLEQQSEKMAMQQELYTALQVLEENERYVLEHTFGIGGIPESTFAEIGRHLQLSRERVRVIHNTALKKLQKSAHGVDLYNFIHED